MRTKSRQSGVTLTEVTVVVATIALLVSFGLPVLRALLHSFESRSGARSVISAALASARAIAAREQRYAGIRFQQDSAGKQYMVFIIHEEPGKMRGLTIGFRALDGAKPIKLPDTVVVMDLRYNPDLFSPPGDGLVDSDVEIDNVNVLRDTSSFSIIFSPSGRLVIRDVRVRNRDGVFQPNNDLAASDPDKFSRDDIFNSPVNIDNHGVGMFIQDDYPTLGLWTELSRDGFVICDRTQFDELDTQGRLDYLSSLDIIYVNRYTGTMISPD